ncbi:hypothetical protein VPH35_081473 [Triticum aestivum]
MEASSSSPDLEVCRPQFAPSPSALGFLRLVAGSGGVWGWCCRSGPGETPGWLVRPGIDVGLGQRFFLGGDVVVSFSPPPFPLPSENPKSGRIGQRRRRVCRSLHGGVVWGVWFLA